MDREVKLPAGLQLVNGKLNTVLRCAYEPMLRERKKLELSSFIPENFDDLTPKPGDYLRVQFRALSAAYLGESGYWLDFSRPGVLRASIPHMLIKEKGGTRRRDLMFHRNHLRTIEARIGRIDNAEWGEASGEQSHAGINIDTLIDWKLAPNEARQLMSDPPLVDSVSVAVAFDWEKSHEKLEDWKFWSMLGHEVDGEIVRIVVTEIISYDHIGLVVEGADEEADKLQAANEDLQRTNGHLQDKKSTGGKMKNLTISEKLAKKIYQQLGLEEGEFDEQDLFEAVSALAEANEELKTTNVALQEKATEYQRVMGLRRESVEKLVAKVEGDCKESYKKMLGLMNWEDLAEIEADWQAKLEEKFPLTCQSCGSKKLSVRSSKEEDVHNDGGGKAGVIDPEKFRVA